MKIGITGANGFVGKHLQKSLIKQGFDIELITRQNGYDILDLEGLKSLPKLDTIIHLAAKSYVPDAYKDPQSFFETNVSGTNNILEIARRDDAKFIFLSSYAYGNPEQIPTPESHRLVAANPYAASKILGEDLCNYYKEFFDLNTFILRPFNIYGPGQGDHFLIPKIIRQAQEGAISLFDSTPKRDYVHVLDVVSAIIACVNCNEDHDNHIYNIASGTSHSVADVVDLVVKEFPKDDIAVHYAGSDRPNEIMETIGDISKAYESLKWKPKYDLELGFQEYFESINI